MAELYQLRVVLRDVSPLVWRRLVISSETRIAQLNEILQLASLERGTSPRVVTVRPMKQSNLVASRDRIFLCTPRFAIQNAVAPLPHGCLDQ